MTTGEIHSQRLSLRPIGLDDIEALHSLWIDEPVRRFLWDGKIVPLDRTHEIVETNRVLFDEDGFGIWGIRELGSQELIGFAGYWHFREPPSLELLFGVAPGHWNRGIATEAGLRLICYAFEELGFLSIDASTDVDNTASIRVAEKLGMMRQRRDVVDGLDTVFYRMRRQDWETRNATGSTQVRA